MAAKIRTEKRQLKEMPVRMPNSNANSVTQSKRFLNCQSVAKQSKTKQKGRMRKASSIPETCEGDSDPDPDQHPTLSESHSHSHSH